MFKCKIEKLIRIVCMVFFVLFSVTSMAIGKTNEELQQTQNIKGKITDRTGAPLPGVNVVVKGTTIGVMSGVDGTFAVPANQGSSLVISFIGYITKEVTVAGSEVNVLLEEDVQALDEVVVVGYGTQRKRDLTGSVGATKSEDFQNYAVSNPGAALQGKLAGVEISPSSGDPRAGVNFQIRGQGTFGASSSPLVVIDGIITNQGLTDLDYNSIEEIVVLKDASAAAIYGSRGANGVILVTTKRGTADKPSMRFSTYYSTDNVWRINEPVDNITYANMVNEYFVNSGKAAPYSAAEMDVFRTTPSTNWQNEIYRTAHKQNYELEASGGSKSHLYALSLGYYKGQGLVVNHDYDRYNFRINNDINLFKGMKIGSSLGLSYGTVKQGDPGAAIGASMIYPPTEPAYLPDGKYGIASHVGEPVTMRSPLIYAHEYNNKSIYTRVLFNTFAEYEILKGLKFKTMAGIEYFNTETTNFLPTFDYGTSNNNLTATLNRASNDNKNLQWDNLLTFNRTFGLHNIDALAGFTYQTSKGENFSGYRTGFPSNDPAVQILDNGSANDQARGNYNVWALQSYLGRINYSYLGKYLFTTNLRIDQSSRFPATDRTGIFPSFSAGWVLSEEDFMDGKLGPVSHFKLRGSYGLIGNQDIGVYPYQTTLASNLYYSYGSGTVAVGAGPTSNVNEKISWEKTATSNIGTDIRLLNDRLSIIADYYNRITSDVLVRVPLPSVSGRSGNPYQNIGTVRNRGFEFTVNYGNMNTKKDFTYEVGFNLTTNRNKVTKLSTEATIITQGGAQAQYEYRTEEGHEINEYFGYVQAGVFQTTEEIASWPFQANAAPGDIKYVDLNNDNVIDSKDRKYIGSSQVRQMIGFNATAKYKNFDVSMSMNGEFGKSMYILTAGFNLVRMGEITSAMYNDRWTGPGTSNYVPRLVAGDPNNNSRMSTFWLRSQNYARIQNAQLGYTLPSSIVKKINMETLRIYVAGQNLLTFDSFPGYDPELGTNGYPIPRSIYFGLNVGF